MYYFYAKPMIINISFLQKYKMNLIMDFLSYLKENNKFCIMIYKDNKQIIKKSFNKKHVQLFTKNLR